MFSLPAPIMEATIMVIMMTAAAGANGSSFSATDDKYSLSKTPATMGSKTTWTVLKNKPSAETSTLLPTSKVVIKGVNIMANKVLTAVIETERATSALAKKLITFEAVPPGQLATNIKPIENSKGK